MSNTKAKDLVGSEINGFKILDWKRENRRTYLLTVCPFCQNKKWIRKDHLDSGNIKSCGCYNSSNNIFKSENISGKTFGRLTAIKPTNRKETNGSILWECKCTCGNTTYKTSTQLQLGIVNSCGCLSKENSIKNGKNVGKFIKENFCLEGTNIKNLTAKTPKNNTSGIKGVFWDKRKNKWVSQIYFKGKNYYLGRYENIEDAEEARKKAEEKFFGSFLKKYSETHPE